MSSIPEALRNYKLPTGLLQDLLRPTGAGEKGPGGRPQAPAKGRLPLRTPLFFDLATALKLPKFAIDNFLSR